MLLRAHVVAGSLAIVCGAVALLAGKGRTLHRNSGLLFVCAMTAMGATGSVLALRQSLTNPNALGGVMSVYFVTTGLLTVRLDSTWKRRFTVAAAILGAAVALAWFRLGIRGLVNRPPQVDPAMVYSTFVFGAAMCLGVLGDLRGMRTKLMGASRLRRHLWRMCAGFLIALASFLAIPERVARIFPEPLTTPLLRAAPVLLVFAAMFYWLWKLRRHTIARPASVSVNSV